MFPFFKNFQKWQKPVLPAFLLLLSGCSSLQGPDTTANRQKTQQTEPEIVTKYLPEESSVKKDQTGLTEDVLYKLMVAEIAGQRGNVELAIRNYMELAKKIKDPALAERATRILIYARKDQKALEAAKLWVNYAPENMEAHQVLVAMYIRNNQSGAALKELEQILDKYPESTASVLQMLAGFLNRSEDRDTAQKVMEQLMAKRQDDDKAMFAYGLLILRSGDTAKAREIIKKVTELAPNEKSYKLVYLSLLEKEDKQSAFKYLEKLLDQHPDDINFRIAHARMLADFGRFDEAREEFKSITKSHPDNTDARYALGLLNLQTNHPKEAKQAFKFLIKKQVLVNESSYYLGQVAEFEKHLEKAIRWYEAVDNTSPLYFDAQIKIAIIKARQGNIDESQKILTNLQPQNRQQQLQKVRVEAEILVEKGKLQEAMKVYDRAIGDGHDPDLLYSRAMLAEKIGRIDILERDLKTVIKHDPDNADVLNALGYTLANRTTRYQEAYEYIKRAHELSPDNFYILDSMGWVLYRLGRLDEAVKYLKRARELNNDPEIAAHLSEVLWVKGEKDEARKVLENALMATPEDEKLLKVLKDVVNKQ